MGKSTRAGLAGTDMNTAFEVRNLYAFYGKKRPKDSENMVLRDVNLVIPSGSALGIIGPNGAGKSTHQRGRSIFSENLLPRKNAGRLPAAVR